MPKPRFNPTSQSSWGLCALTEGDVVTDENGRAYRVVRLIGRGGMGEVYEVVCDADGSRYALKCLLLQHVRDAKTLERARREAMMLRDLRHPNVVRVHATGVRPDGLIWMVMDLLSGHTLEQVRLRLGKVPLLWALRIGRSIADGLEAVHAHAVHRDLKPDNIHFGDDAVIRVLDLGAGKFHQQGLLTTGGRLLGTVPYMSPEQILASVTVDARSDLFALGVTLVELISGVHPFALKGLDKESVFTLIAKITAQPPAPLKTLAPWVPDDVAQIIERTLARDRSQRPGSAAELAAALAVASDRVERAFGAGEPLETLALELRSVVAVPASPSAFGSTVDASGNPTAIDDTRLLTGTSATLFHATATAEPQTLGFTLKRYAELEVAIEGDRDAGLGAVLVQFGIDAPAYAQIQDYWRRKFSENGLLTLDFGTHGIRARKERRSARATAPAPAPSAPESLPELNVEQYAWLVATLRKTAPADLPTVLTRVRLTPETRKALEERWSNRLAADPVLRETFLASLARHLAAGGG